MNNEQKRWLNTFVINNKICDGCGVPVPNSIMICPLCKAYRFQEDPIALRDRIMADPKKFGDEWHKFNEILSSWK